MNYFLLDSQIPYLSFSQSYKKYVQIAYNHLIWQRLRHEQYLRNLFHLQKRPLESNEEQLQQINIQYRKVESNRNDKRELSMVNSNILPSLPPFHNSLRLYFESKSSTLNASNSLNSTQVEGTSYKIENEVSSSDHSPFEIQTATPRTKTQILDILEFLIRTFGKSSPHEVEQEKKKYAYDVILMKIFDILSQKFFETTKGREDMIRLLIRKALTFMKNKLREDLKINSKEASLILCKRCFLPTSKLEITNEIEDKILEFFLPYKKNSRNKTPNAQFIEEIFVSDEFLQGYKIYLTNFDEMMKMDNQKKVNRFVAYIENCVAKQQMHKIKEYKRLPWASSWIESMKIVAIELLDKNIAKASVAKYRKTEKV